MTTLNSSPLMSTSEARALERSSSFPYNIFISSGMLLKMYEPFISAPVDEAVVSTSVILKTSGLGSFLHADKKTHVTSIANNKSSFIFLFVFVNAKTYFKL